MKIPSVGAELFLAGGRTYMKPTVAFRNIANAPKMVDFSYYSKLILSKHC
jgi:hypothetical protein